MCTLVAFQWLTGAVCLRRDHQVQKMSPSDDSFNDGCHWSPSGRSAPLQLFIIWTDKGTIPTSETLWVICAKVNRAPRFHHIHGADTHTGASVAVLARFFQPPWRSTTVVSLFPTTFIDRSLSAMNGCKANEGGENPELQVTDHGSGFTQAGRGRKKLHRMALEKKGEVRNKTWSHFLKSMLARRQTYSVPRLGSQTMRLKLDVYSRGNEVYRAWLG